MTGLTFELPCKCLVSSVTQHIIRFCPACEAMYQDRHTRAVADHAAREPMPEKRKREYK